MKLKKVLLLTIFLLLGLTILMANDYPVINEVMHSAPYGYRWIEIYNPSPFPFPLSNWQLQIAGEVFETVFIFPNVILLPREYIVIGERDVSFADYITELEFGNEDIVCGIRIIDERNLYQDTILYGYENPYNLADDNMNPAKYFVTPASINNSLARNPNGYDTNSISDWDIAERPTPGTPNFIYFDLALKELYIDFKNDIQILHIVIHDLSTHDVYSTLITLSIFLNNISIYENIPNITFYNKIASFTFPLNLIINQYYIIKAEISYPHDVDNSNNSKTIEFWHGQKPIIINELQYAPFAPEPEWIEFFNPTDDVTILNNAYFTDSAGRRSTFDVYIEPFDYFIVTQSINNLLLVHPHLDRAKIVQPSPWAILVNTRDTVELFFENGVKVDSVSYVGVNSMRGRSLERKNPWVHEDVEWVYSTDLKGSTPLSKNSQTPSEIDLKIKGVKILEQDGLFSHCVEIINNGYLKNFCAYLSLFYKNEEIEEYRFINEKDIFQTGEYFFTSDYPIIKGYHNYMYKINHEKETDIKIKTYLNEKPPVVVNEIMFNPNNNEPIWIEFIKTRDKMPLNGLKFFARTDSIHIPYFDGDFALLTVNARDSLYMRENFSIPSNVPIYLRLRTLLNAGMPLILMDYDENLYEEFAYKQSYSPLKGISTERISPLLPPEDQNWAASLTIATPGKKNSVQMNIIPTSKSLEIVKNPFSPFKNEHCMIKISVNDQQVRADIKVFDIKGREIIKLADKMIIPGEYVFIWNGLDIKNKPVSPGVYPLYVNIETLAGSKLLQEKKLIYIGY